MSDLPKTDADISQPETAPDLDRRWHLAGTDHEIAVAELEYAMIRSYEAFGRWQTARVAATHRDTREET